jgi:isopenicillin-N epimerase
MSDRLGDGHRLDLKEDFLIRPDVVFLNHGSFGACPRPVFERYQRWQLELERQPVEFLGRRFEELMYRARSVLGRYVGADPEDLVYVPNATTGLNVIARSLALRPGDEVLATDHEYGALDRTWRFVCRRRGATYINQPVPLPVSSAEGVVEAIWSGVTRRTRVLFVSHITSPTALILPVAELVRRCRERGIVSIVDGAHGPGQLPLDLDAMGADYYVANLHKWALAPKGAAFLHARREVQHRLEPLVVSWGWESDRPGRSRFVEEQQWQGTRDPAAYLAVPAAIRFMEERDWSSVRARCHALLRALRREVEELTGLAAASVCPDSPAWYAQMAALPLSTSDTDRAEAEMFSRRLYDEYRVEVPIIVWGGRLFVRVSIQAYNTEADVQALTCGLRTLLELPGFSFP